MQYYLFRFFLFNSKLLFKNRHNLYWYDMIDQSWGRSCLYFFLLQIVIWLFYDFFSNLNRRVFLFICSKPSLFIKVLLFCFSLSSSILQFFLFFKVFLLCFFDLFLSSVSFCFCSVFSCLIISDSDLSSNQ